MRNIETSKESDDTSWIDEFVAPPHAEDLRKLLGALSSFDDASPYLTRVRQVVVDDALRSDLGISLYDGTAWGVIRWRRALGRPATPRLSAGFSVVHQYDFSLDVSPGAGSGQTIGGWVPAGDPTLWDGPDDADTFAVSFMVQGIHRWRNRVTVGMRNGVEWQPADDPWLTQRRRVVAYPTSLPDGEFDVSRSTPPIDLGIFEVVRSW